MNDTPDVAEMTTVTIVNQLYDLLTDEISRRIEGDQPRYLFVDARQASNDLADAFVTRMLDRVRHEHGERIAKAIEDDRNRNHRGLTELCHAADARIARDLSPAPEG